MIRLLDIFKQSRLNNRAEYVQKEVGKLGNLRAGSSGIYTEQGEVAGTCHRKAHLRSLGLDIEEPTEDKLIMFDLGYASEDIILAKLKSALPADHMVLSEEQIPIEWQTRNGTKVTGRPDHVVCRVTMDTVKPVLGLELKSVHSMWTARDVLFGGKPKIANIIQAAHYMWKLDIPYKIVYTGYSQLGQGMAGDKEGWKLQNWPKPGEMYSEYIEYSYWKKTWKRVVSKKTGQEEWKASFSKTDADTYHSLPENEQAYSIKHIKQFEIIYDLKRDRHGRVHYKLEQDEEWIPTVVTTHDIERFYETVSTMAETDDLGPRPTAIDAIGGKASYSDCDYCPLQATCNSYEKAGYKQWLKEVAKVSINIADKVSKGSD